MKYLTVTTLNARGLGNNKKRNEVLNKHWFSAIDTDNEVDVLLIQEAHSTLSDERFWSLNFRTNNIFFSHDTTASGGLIIAVKQRLPFVLLHSVTTVNYIILHCTIADEEYVLVNVHNRYFTCKNRRQKIVRLLSQMWDTVQKFNCHRILIGGDFNLSLDCTVDGTQRSLVDQILIDFLEDTDLVDSWRLFHPSTLRNTWHGHSFSRPTGSRIDYIFVSPLLANYLHASDIGLSFQSDHSPVTSNFLLHRNPKGKGLFRFPNYLIHDVTYCEMLASVVSDVVRSCSTDLSERDRPCPSLLWDTVKAAIRGRTLEYLTNAKREKRQYRSLAYEVHQLQGLVDEYIFQDGPLDDLLKELDTKKEELSTFYDKITDRTKRRNIARADAFSNTCSKYFFRKVKGIPGSLRCLFNDADVLVSTDQELLTLCSEFYENLYSTRAPTFCKLSNYSFPPPDRYLSDAHRDLLAAEITKEDLEFALKSMTTGKSPGADGFTVEFYRKFWPIVGTLVYDSIAAAQNNGHFTYAQRQGILKLLPKPKKDPRFVKHLRPITLLNVDYKLFTKVLADRVKQVIPTLIHTDQNGFVKNRFLGNNVLDVYSLIALAEESDDDENYALLALDIEKAFDSVNWQFLRTTLWGFGFPKEFINFVTLTHQRAFVQILNNGHLSDSIVLQQGLAQGCGLSPYLFILAIEGLANTIRGDSRIPGIPVGVESKKVAQVADDSLLSFIGSSSTILRIRNVLDHFSLVSGLKLNYDKSTLIALGSTIPLWFNDPCVSSLKKIHISEGFSYLGIYVTNDGSKMQRENFDINPSIVPSLLESRAVRRTSLSGRILQVKQLVSSTFVYRFQLAPSPSPFQLDILQRAFFDYIWESGRHRLKADFMYQPKADGGFAMVNVAVQNQSLKFAWFNRLFSESVNISFWVTYLYNSFIIPLPDVLNCNIHPTAFSLLFKPGVHLPSFWRDVFGKWFRQFYVSIDCNPPNDQRKIAVLPVIFNSGIVVPQVWLSPDIHYFLQQNDILTLDKFVQNFNHFIQSVTVVDQSLSFALRTLKSRVPNSWLQILVQTPVNTACLITDRLFAGLLPSKEITRLLLPKISNTRIIGKWEVDLDCTIENFLWEKIVKKANVCFDPYLRDFHIQFLHRGFHYNVMSSKYNNSSSLCSFCNTYEESYVHLFWECAYVMPLWTALNSICYENVDMEDFSMFKCLMSNFQSSLLCLMTMLLKRYIHCCKFSFLTPTVYGYIKKLRSLRNVHYNKCKVRNNVTYYHKFWDILANDLFFDNLLQTWQILDE